MQLWILIAQFENKLLTVVCNAFTPPDVVGRREGLGRGWTSWIMFGCSFRPVPGLSSELFGDIITLLYKENQYSTNDLALKTTQMYGITSLMQIGDIIIFLLFLYELHGSNECGVAASWRASLRPSLTSKSNYVDSKDPNILTDTDNIQYNHIGKLYPNHKIEF